MALTPPPPIPNRNDPATFSARTDAFLAWLATFVDEYNAQAFQAGVANGTAALPSIYFKNDPNTGLFLNAADKMGLVAGGTELLQIDGVNKRLFAPNAINMRLGADQAEVVTGSNASATTGLGSVSSATIMDYGSNSNGDWWRFLNGVCIQQIVIPTTETLAINGATGNASGIFSSSPIQKTWPLGDYQLGSVIATIIGLHQAGWVDCNFSNGGRWNFTARAYNNAIAAGAYSIRATSIGRWK